MGLSDLASIGSLVSGVAGIISLIYLSIQVRLADRNQQASIRQGRSTRTVNLFMETTNPSLCDAISKGFDGDDDISATQFRQFRNYWMAQISHAEDSFYQHENLLLNDAAFETFIGALKNAFRSPGVRAVWKGSRDTCAGEFVEFMDNVYAETTVGPAIDSFALWKADVAKEKLSAMQQPTSR